MAKQSTMKVTLGSVVGLSDDVDSNKHIDSDVASRFSVGSSIDRVGLLDDRFELVKKRHHYQPVLIGAKSVILSLPARNADSHCTHYTHSASCPPQ